MNRTQWTAASDPRGAKTREFRVERPDQRAVTGALWLPDEPRAGAPLVAVGHGASGDRYQLPIPYLARRLTREAGYAVLSMDGPVHGLREVSPGGRAALAVEMQRPTAVEDMVEDWHVALATVRELSEVGAGPLAYFGLSMGAIFGIPLLASREDVDVAVLGLLGTSGPAVQGLSGIARLKGAAAAIRCPLFFVMQLEDELFDRPGYLELFDAFASEDKRLHANPGRHPQLPAEEVDFAFDFLLTHLEGTAKREIMDPLAD